MSSSKGVIALMGSGELTDSMVEVHKQLLAGTSRSPRAVFLDTPAGFQLNVDQLSEKAVEYFHTRVQQAMSVASFKSTETTTPYEAEQAFHTLRQADYVLIGPGSPSYAIRHWRQTPIPDILASRVEAGGCLVAADAVLEGDRRVGRLLGVGHDDRVGLGIAVDPVVDVDHGFDPRSRFGEEARRVEQYTYRFTGFAMGDRAVGRFDTTVGELHDTGGFFMGAIDRSTAPKPAALAAADRTRMA